MNNLKKDMANDNREKKNLDVLVDVKESVGILEKLVNIFISIFSIFKSNNSAKGRD